MSYTLKKEIDILYGQEIWLSEYELTMLSENPGPVGFGALQILTLYDLWVGMMNLAVGFRQLKTQLSDSDSTCKVRNIAVGFRQLNKNIAVGFQQLKAQLDSHLA